MLMHANPTCVTKYATQQVCLDLVEWFKGDIITDKLGSWWGSGVIIVLLYTHLLPLFLGVLCLVLVL